MRVECRWPEVYAPGAIPRAVLRWLIAAAGLASHLASVARPARAADDDPYAWPKSWLCRPGASDVCAAPVVATIVQSDGSRANRFKQDPSAPIDCFYVYPTVSEDPAGNSGMTSGPGEQWAVAQQFAAFASVCRPFAPIYRQVTIAGVEAVLRHEPLPVDFKLPYEDVRAAWRHYLANDNGGRGVVLIGHSQGAQILARLIVHEIEGEPEQRLLAGASSSGSTSRFRKARTSAGRSRPSPSAARRGRTAASSPTRLSRRARPHRTIPASPMPKRQGWRSPAPIPPRWPAAGSIHSRD